MAVLTCGSRVVRLVGCTPVLPLHRKILCQVEARPWSHGGEGALLWWGAMVFFQQDLLALQIVGISPLFPLSQHVTTCCLFTKHLPVLECPPKDQLWDRSTSFYQGWLLFSNIPPHCKRADDILLGFQRTGSCWKLQDSRCSALAVNSSHCYIGEVMYQSPGISPCSEIMMAHNSSSSAFQAARPTAPWDLGQLRPWDEDISQHVWG